MTKKFHIHPETGNASPCRAEQGRCPFGSEEEHYPSAREARDAFEKKASGEGLAPLKKERRQHAATLQALTSPLKWEGEEPKWVRELSDKEEAVFGTRTAEIIDVIEDTPVGPVAVVYQVNNPDDNSKWIQIERGFQMPSIRLQGLEDGQEYGYLKTAYVDDESIERSWGNDEWTSLDMVEEYNGSRTGLREYSKDDDDSRKIRTIGGGQSPEEELAAKKKIWTKAFHALHLYPPSLDRSKLAWGSLINVKLEDAPAGEVLEQELKMIQAAADKQLDSFKHGHGQPTIDYSKLHREVNGKPGLRGKGFGPALYVYTARKLAEKGLTLRGSGIQSDEAQALWDRLQQDKTLPITPMKKVWPGPPYQEQDSYVLDFTEGQEGTKREQARTAMLQERHRLEEAAYWSAMAAEEDEAEWEGLV